MSEKKTELRHLPLTQVRPNEVALRSVDKESEKYLGLVDSIKAKGVLNAIVVREMKDEKTGAKFYALIDGLHRFTAAGDAGLESIPAQIVTANDVSVLEMQIIGNIHKVETKPVQYSEQLHRLLTLDPLTTTQSLAARLGKSITWINDRLGLIKLNDQVRDLVDNGEINITNAYQLAKLPPDEQVNFVDRAITMTPNQFVPTATARLKELRDAKRAGRMAEGPKEFQAPMFLQKISVIKEEIKSLQNCRSICNQYNLTDPEEVWKMALSWALHLDPTSVELAKQKELERQRQAEAARAAKKAEREKKKQEEAMAVAAGVEEE